MGLNYIRPGISGQTNNENLVVPDIYNLYTDHVQNTL